MKISKYLSEVIMFFLFVISVVSLNIPAFYVSDPVGESSRMTIKSFQILQYSPFGLIACLIPFLLIALYYSALPRNTKTILLFVIAILSGFCFNHAYLETFNGLHINCQCFVKIKPGVILTPAIMFVSFVWFFLCFNKFKYKM